MLAHIYAVTELTGAMWALKPRFVIVQRHMDLECGSSGKLLTTGGAQEQLFAHTQVKLKVRGEAGQRGDALVTEVTAVDNLIAMVVQLKSMPSPLMLLLVFFLLEYERAHCATKCLGLRVHTL